MKFGLCVGAKIDDIDYIVLAERLGYHSAWVADSQMIWSDCYATLALAAERTSRIRLGTGVAIAGTRIAPVTAHSIATINRLAPGRTFLALGTGHTAMRVMGQQPMKLKEFRQYAHTVRDLLDGHNTPYTYGGRTRDIRFIHQTQGYIQLEPRIPMIIAGSGPATQRFAGSFGDGLVTGGATRPEVCRACAANVREGAERAGRQLPEDFDISTLSAGIVLDEGESLAGERAIRETGSQVMAMLHGLWERVPEPKRDLATVPEYVHDVWEAYCDFVDAMETPPERRYQQIHLGHCSFLVDEEARFVTPNGIRAAGLAGTPREIVAQIRGLEAAGLTQILLLPPTAHASKVLTDFATRVFPLLAVPAVA
jgi:alkanesulfonate monooxygenase SsuD/methylene tetrahydromethanopterin reductase-like flavin-dependent oxidoreductase (luciferase family)